MIQFIQAITDKFALIFLVAALLGVLGGWPVLVEIWKLLTSLYRKVTGQTLPADEQARPQNIVEDFQHWWRTNRETHRRIR